ncbi:HNH endonuclease signature motif containing protein [Bacillus subtilis]|uniref:HNH endonuclease signature motif containing protein n=1 Tax=Bacillus subtilis TaxID=1423 RepID=UPI000A35A49C|nr:HNH endonuclease signature motif containing protein [Bacillus subtilis]MBU8716505.1 HNH endonuclease [Bacillus subtilis]
MIRKEVEEAPWWITETGIIISKKLKKPRKTFITPHGYEMIGYTHPKKGTQNFLVHRLVAKYFIHEIPKGMFVNHKDGNKLNNHVRNLEIVTPKENTLHAMKIGLMSGQPGESNSMSKLTNMEATNLIYDLIAGMNNVEAGEKYSLHPRYVSLIRHKRRWKTLWDRIERSTTIA